MTSLPFSTDFNRLGVENLLTLAIFSHASAILTTASLFFHRFFHIRTTAVEILFSVVWPNRYTFAQALLLILET